MEIKVWSKNRIIFSGIFISIVFFIVLASQVLSDSWVVFVDNKIVNYLSLEGSSFWTYIFMFITLLADKFFIASAGALVLLYLYIKKRFDYMAGFLITLAGSAISAQILKITFERARPFNSLILESSFSFPSAHALGAVALYGFIAFIIWEMSRNKSLRISTLSASVLLIALISFSRLYLGVHFLSDVIGGILIGFVWLLIGILVNIRLRT